MVGEADVGGGGEGAEEADVGVAGEVVGAEADDSDECDCNERNNPRSTVKRTRRSHKKDVGCRTNIRRVALATSGSWG